LVTNGLPAVKLARVEPVMLCPSNGDENGMDIGRDDERPHGGLAFVIVQRVVGQDIWIGRATEAAIGVNDRFPDGSVKR